MENKKFKIFAPASVANVSCGFDILGFPINNTGDIIEIETIKEKGVVIGDIQGLGNLSKDPAKNVCGVVAMAMLEKANVNYGVKLNLTKGILPGSGLGSSAASSSGAAFAVNQILGTPFNDIELIEFAMLGEALASGTAHADNVSPALLGGFVAVRSYTPLDVIKIPVPEELFCAVIHPKIELRTELSRNILKKQVELKTAIKQWGNIAGLVAGLYSCNYELIGRSLTDHIVEPVRSLLIPGFTEITNAAKNAGALGTGISGSGPSIFSLNKGEEAAVKVSKAMAKAADHLDIPYDIHVSPIAKQGCRLI